MVNSGEHGVIASMVLSPTISPSPPPTATATLLIASPPEFMEPSTTVIDEVGSPAIDDLEELLASSGATSSLVIPSSDEVSITSLRIDVWCTYDYPSGSSFYLRWDIS